MVIAVAVIVTGVCLIVSTKSDAPAKTRHLMTSGHGQREQGCRRLAVQWPGIRSRPCPQFMGSSELGSEFPLVPDERRRAPFPSVRRIDPKASLEISATELDGTVVTL